MLSSDYNCFLAAIKAANDSPARESLRQIQKRLVANYGPTTPMWTISSVSSATMCKISEQAKQKERFRRNVPFVLLFYNFQPSSASMAFASAMAFSWAAGGQSS